MKAIGFILGALFLWRLPYAIAAGVAEVRARRRAIARLDRERVALAMLGVRLDRLGRQIAAPGDTLRHRSAAPRNEARLAGWHAVRNTSRRPTTKRRRTR